MRKITPPGLEKFQTRILF